MDKRRGALLAAGAALLSVALCLALYNWDNKYTRPGAQPINGLLILSEEDLAATPLRYLIREWEYWPGALLTPAELAGKSGYRQYISIGETSSLEA